MGKVWTAFSTIECQTSSSSYRVDFLPSFFLRINIGLEQKVRGKESLSILEEEVKT